MNDTAHTATDGVQAPERAGEAPAGAPVRISAFDFDGTLIGGNSPVLLVRYLNKLGKLDKSVVARILLWGIAYKLRLPQNESWVRGLVFRAFSGEPAPKVDAFLRDFYDSHVAKLFRSQASAELAARHAAGDVVVVVSATFEPIIERMMESHPVDFQLSTRMRIADDGTYTCEVEGLPVEGDQKLVRLREFADARYGKGNWVLEAAYGDHHSDRTLLAAAKHPVAVCPDRPLSRTARAQGWRAVEW